MQQNKNIQLCQTQTMGIGVFALDEIKKGQVLFLLDEQAYITYSLCLDDEVFYWLNQYHPERKNRIVQFALYMAYKDKIEKSQDTDPDDKVLNYIRSLPSCSQNLVCWSIEQLEMLQNTALIKKIINKKDQIICSAGAIRKYLIERISDCLSLACHDLKQADTDTSQSSIGQVPFKEYLSTKKESFQRSRQVLQAIINEDVFKFYAMIESRKIYFQAGMDSKSEVGALIPNLQLLNHSFDSQVEKNGLEIKTIKSIKEGEQIFISYCDQSQGNDYLLERYGFIMDQNFELYKNMKKKAEPQNSQKKGFEVCKNLQLKSKHNIAQRYNKSKRNEKVEI